MLAKSGGTLGRSFNRPSVRSPPTRKWCSLGRRERIRVGRVEGLDTGLAVAVERRRRAVRAETEVAVVGVGEPAPDSVEIDPLANAVDERRRESLLHDQAVGVVSVSVGIVGEIIDVLGGPERRPRLLEQNTWKLVFGGR